MPPVASRCDGHDGLSSRSEAQTSRILASGDAVRRDLLFREIRWRHTSVLQSQLQAVATMHSPYSLLFPDYSRVFLSAVFGMVDVMGYDSV
jgi:hypothetical protein